DDRKLQQTIGVNVGQQSGHSNLLVLDVAASLACRLFRSSRSHICNKWAASTRLTDKKRSILIAKS
ncbi:MAG: hypothetical protein RSD82_11795, partial [Comamonas sp.]